MAAIVALTAIGTFEPGRELDGKFTALFDEALRDARLLVRKTASQSPNTQAFAERFIQTMQQQCLDYFIPIGLKHLDQLLAEAVAHYHEERPHQALGNSVLAPLSKSKPRREKKAKSPDETTYPCQRSAASGGLLKHYYRQAA